MGREKLMQRKRSRQTKSFKYAHADAHIHTTHNFSFYVLQAPLNGLHFDVLKHIKTINKKTTTTQKHTHTLTQNNINAK